MTILYSSWGFQCNNTSTPDTLFFAVPLFRQCPKWTAPSAFGAENHKLKMRAHVTTTATLTIDVQADAEPDNPIEISEASGTTNDWTDTWANADYQQDYPKGSPWSIYDPTLSPSWAPAKMEFLVDSGTQYIHGIQIGQITDIAYDGNDGIVISRSGATRPYLDNDPASAMLMTSAIAETLNKILYECEWRICTPITGGR